MDRLVGVLTLYSTEVLIVNTSPWDGAVNGRCETTIRCTEPWNKQRVRDFLRGVNPLYAVVSECLASGPREELVRETPFVLISRYRGNRYLCLGNCSPTLFVVVKEALTAPLHSVYGICLKWEPHGSRNTWGEGSIAPKGCKVSLLRKGVNMDGEVGEWERWVDVTSPQSKVVWQSQFLLYCKNASGMPLPPRIFLRTSNVPW